MRQLGVEIRERTPVQRFLVQGGRVQGVVLGDGRELTANATVCTVNAWANSLLSGVGQAMPSRNFVIERHLTRPFARAPRLPATDDDVRSIYYRPTEDRRLLIGGGAHEFAQVPMPGSDFEMCELEPDPVCLPTTKSGLMPYHNFTEMVGLFEMTVGIEGFGKFKNFVDDRFDGINLDAVIHGLEHFPASHVDSL